MYTLISDLVFSLPPPPPRLIVFLYDLVVEQIVIESFAGYNTKTY